MTEKHDSGRTKHLSTFAKARLLTLVGYVGVISLVLHKNAYGQLSDRAVGFALVVATFSMFLLGALFSVFEQRARKTVSSAAVGPIDEASRKRRILLMRYNQGWIIVLAVLLPCGLFRMRGDPVWAMLAVAAIGLILMASKIRQVRQIRGSLKPSSY